MIHGFVFSPNLNEMNTNKILIAGVAGGIAAFLFGFLIWGLAMQGFMESHSLAPAGLEKEPMLMWAIIVGNLAFGFLYAIIYGRWAGIKTLKTGAVAGVVIGLLIGINYDFMTYAMMNVMDLTGVMVDIVVNAVYGGLVGGVVGWVLGMGKES